MNRFRVALAAGMLAAAMGPFASAHAQDTSEPTQAAAADPTGVHDFDFLVGEWRVHHRKKHQVDGHEWSEFEGTSSHRLLMDGRANVEDHWIDAPGGAYRAVGLRAYDAKTGQWAIWWLDGRYPSGPVGPPVKGRFENGVGTFYSDYTVDGKAMRGRFLWSHITSTSARWEQAQSADAGKTWETNWIMNFQRASARSSRDAPKPTQAAANPAGARGFDFLRGDWRVDHRYLRLRDDGREWLETDGTCSHRTLMDGWANVEDYVINAPGGAYRAVGLRSYDAKTGQWAIWWLDGRDPHGDLGPPVEGRFENGVGTFYGDQVLSGKPTRVRFIWSRITPTSARWEQAYSADTGQTWETNWTMDFRRSAPPSGPARRQ